MSEKWQRQQYSCSYLMTSQIVRVWSWPVQQTSKQNYHNQTCLIPGYKQR